MTSNLRTVYLTYGPPGCGKSTWANAVQPKPDFRVNLDTIRAANPNNNPKQNWAMAHDKLRTALRSETREPVVVDNTHLFGYQLDSFVTLIEKEFPDDVLIELVYFVTDLDVCLAFNARRVGTPAHVPENVIREFHAAQKPFGEFMQVWQQRADWFHRVELQHVETAFLPGTRSSS